MSDVILTFPLVLLSFKSEICLSWPFVTSVLDVTSFKESVRCYVIKGCKGMKSHSNKSQICLGPLSWPLAM